MGSERDYNAAADFVDRHVREGRGDKTACIDPSRNITYAQLFDEAARVGPMLARLGVERENRVALVMLDSVDFPVLFWGAIRAGIIPVLLNTRLNADQYRQLLEDSRAKVVFVSTALLPVVQEAAGGLPDLRRLLWSAAVRMACRGWRGFSPPSMSGRLSIPKSKTRRRRWC